MFAECQSSTSGSHQSGICVLVGCVQCTAPTWWGSSLCSTQRPWFRLRDPVQFPEEEPKILGFVLWLNYYYFVLSSSHCFCIYSLL